MNKEVTRQSDSDIVAWLEKKGWKKFNSQIHSNTSHTWYKQYSEVKPRCNCNWDKPGIQIVLVYYDCIPRMNVYNVELCGECYDKQWVKFQAYNISAHNIKLELDIQVKKLIRAWQAANYASLCVNCSLKKEMENTWSCKFCNYPNLIDADICSGCYRIKEEVSLRVSTLRNEAKKD